MRVSNEPKELNFEEDLKFDVHALDFEAQNQPNLYFLYSNELAKAMLTKDHAKQSLLVARARVRETLANSGAKVTEGSVEEALASTRENHDYIRASYEVEVLDGAVKAMQQRKDMIELQAKLIAMQYCAAPKEPRELGSGAGARQQEKIGRGLNKER